MTAAKKLKAQFKTHMGFNKTITQYRRYSVMSKGLKRLLTLTMVVVLVAALAVSCNKPAVENSPSPEPSDEPSPTPEEVRDLGGRIIKVAAWWDMTPQGGTPGGDRQVQRRAEMEEKYNFTFEYVILEWENVNETYSSSVMSGTPFADIATIEDNWLMQHYKLNEVQALDQWFDFSEEKWDPLTVESTTIDGKVYGMATGKWWPRGMVFFNKRIFDEAGLTYPNELMKTKEWTWDKMREYAKALTKDTDNDGVIDQWGLAGMDLDLSMVYSNGGTMASYADGKATLNLRDQKVVNALNYYWNLCNTDKVVYSKYLYGDNPPWDIAATMFEQGHVGMFWYQYWKVDSFRENMEDDYSIVLPPIGPDDPEQSYKAYITGHNFQTIPMNVNKPEDVAFIWNKWTEPFPEDDPDSWKEAHEDRARDDAYFDVLEYMYDNNAYVSVGLWGSVKAAVETWWGPQDSLLKGDKTVAEIIDEYFDTLQQALDDFLKND